MKEIKRIVLSGGGTGGHIYPALALHRSLEMKYPAMESLYIGTEKGLEATIVPKEGLEFASVDIQGLKRSLSLENVRALWLMLTSTHKAKKILKEFKPDVVIGTGGYVCAPVLLAASQLGIPTLIHEQNSVAGVTNKFLSRFVDRIAICFEDVANDFTKVSDKVVLTGNPRGQEVLQYSADSQILAEQFGLDASLPTVLVFGGSRGAPAINEAAFAAMSQWAGRPYQVIVATGSIHYDELMASLTEKGQNVPGNVRVVAYIDNMPAVFQAIELVVCRSGATTLTELTALGLPSILIPSPYVTNNHQEHNANSLVNNEAAIMIKQADLTGQTLFEQVDLVMQQPAQLNNMQTAAKELGVPDAADRLVRAVEELVK